MNENRSKTENWGNPVWCLVSPPSSPTSPRNYLRTGSISQSPSRSQPLPTQLQHKVQVPRLLLLSGTFRRPLFHVSLLSWIFSRVYQEEALCTIIKSDKFTLFKRIDNKVSFKKNYDLIFFPSGFVWGFSLIVKLTLRTTGTFPWTSLLWINV